jgi:hypothetical protein
MEPLSKKIVHTQFLFFALLCFMQFPANAQDSTEIESLISIPPKTNRPVEVTFNLLDLELLNINEVEETWEIRVGLSLTWEDERLAFDAEKFSYDRKIFNDQAALNKINTIWIPKINLRGQRGSSVFLALTSIE